MFASLLRSRQARPSERTPLLAALNRYRARRHEEVVEEAQEDDVDHLAQYEPEDQATGQRRQREGSLLPVFSSQVLDRLPVYNVTHAVRILLIQRCETTLSWDQLRSPQVSQFLVKPIQQQIRSHHFSRGVLYCLLANCLQFRKEAEEHAGNAGVNKTRALICELLAMRLLKDFSMRELIDALSYDFDPLQGSGTPVSGFQTPGDSSRTRQIPRSARISTLELAIRAQAKKFLAHPLVVRQLEAIWAGTIVFHSSADSLHREAGPTPYHGHRNSRLASPGTGPSRRLSPAKKLESSLPSTALLRRTVTLYDPHDASLFKLSRLRVPRYRNLFSTLSFGIMLSLFLAVLAQKSDDITALEVLFWFWSSGYMLDEVVGFSEQGFGLYIMSVWNAFDLGILLMFMSYYILRLYGILMPDVSRHGVAAMAYDVLAATAVLLFPRLFSALDHYRYFSQLLIAFRMMAMDLFAILILILISCSGFFIAFTMAFKRDLGAYDAAYSIFQLVMGFTPAAWDLWGEVNFLGKSLLALFLFICHFLIVTILVTVLTNSFMAIVKNAEEEHQFLFAVNTISMVKSDALFSYIPPTNIIGWLLIPFKYVVPFRTFLRMNRFIIKLSHIPILFSIFLYERVLLSHLALGSTDLVESRGRQDPKAMLPAFSMQGPADLFSPRLREPSVTTFYKDRALEEVFRRPYRDSSAHTRSPWPNGRRVSNGVVSDWMRKMGDEANAPPQEDARSILERLETRNRPGLRRSRTAGLHRRKTPLIAIRDTVSDPEDNPSYARPIAEEDEADMDIAEVPQQTDADGDDEDDHASSTNQMTLRAALGSTNENKGSRVGNGSTDEEYFRTPLTAFSKTATRPLAEPSPSSGSSFQDMSPSRKSPFKSKPGHSRNFSTNTVLFSPTIKNTSPVIPSSPEKHPRAPTRDELLTGLAEQKRTEESHGSGSRTLKFAPGPGPASRPRAIPPPRDVGGQGRNIAELLALDHRKRQRSVNAFALDLASDLGDNHLNPHFGNLAAPPASFTAPYEMAARMKARETKNSDSESDSNRMSRIMLARMTTLEEGFRDMLKEVKGLKQGESQTNSRGTRTPPNEPSKKKGKAKRRADRRDSREERVGSSL